MNKIIVLLLAVFAYLQSGFCQELQQKILISSVNTITLREGKFTTGRRLAPVPQLRCVSGRATCQSQSLPSVVQCYNKGSDGLSIQWRCEAQMSKRLKFDTIQVSCEGYDHPNDPYILAGSCGLTYSLRWSGRRRHRKHGIHGHLFRRVHIVNPMVSVLTGLLAFTVVVAMLALVFKLFRSRRHRYHRVYTAEEGPPPPPPPSHYGYHHSGGSGPGFWSGAAMGGMTGYMMGSAASAPHHFGGHSAPCEVAYESDFVVGGDSGSAFSDDDIGSAVGFGSGWNR
ncbi:hypothetical protein BOX15_Mlig000794g1 [Macrostomum lignano]|uniref:Store-operated calcium entry-associated regulatory factor n=2 Tax=Macrostomum lignano TaxID=282301 RepID=A0A1I8I719_9PLAT|nr:hypothetical protein BOX15_Mlig000794g1 [Macrostomum lignano]